MNTSDLTNVKINGSPKNCSVLKNTAVEEISYKTCRYKSTAQVHISFYPVAVTLNGDVFIYKTESCSKTSIKRYLSNL
jgi:hypothetical protein